MSKRLTQEEAIDNNKHLKYKLKYLKTGSNGCFSQPILFD